ncbi:hypothetical protein C8J56DRAFT_901642 [Mycena floridula]|nr:hypothetical protein C8J56DRAFT_901642 [Mycena floridula]
MGRPKKYLTEMDRKNALTSSKKAYYQRYERRQRYQLEKSPLIGGGIATSELEQEWFEDQQQRIQHMREVSANLQSRFDHVQDGMVAEGTPSQPLISSLVSFILDENPIEAEAFVEQVVNFVRDVVQEAETCSEGWWKEWGNCEEWRSTQSMCGTLRTYVRQLDDVKRHMKSGQHDNIIIRDNHFYRTLGANRVTATGYSLTYTSPEPQGIRKHQKGGSGSKPGSAKENMSKKGKKVDGSETILSRVMTQVKEATKLQEGHQSRPTRHSSKAIENGNADLRILLVEATVHGLHDKVVALLAPYEKKFGPLTATETAKVSDNEAKWDVSAQKSKKKAKKGSHVRKVSTPKDLVVPIELAPVNEATETSTSNGIDHEYVERLEKHLGEVNDDDLPPDLTIGGVYFDEDINAESTRTAKVFRDAGDLLHHGKVFGKALSEKREKRKAETVESLPEQSTRSIATNTTAASQPSKRQKLARKMPVGRVSPKPLTPEAPQSTIAGGDEVSLTSPDSNSSTVNSETPVLLHSTTVSPPIHIEAPEVSSILPLDPLPPMSPMRLIDMDDKQFFANALAKLLVCNHRVRSEDLEAFIITDDQERQDNLEFFPSDSDGEDKDEDDEEEEKEKSVIDADEWLGIPDTVMVAAQGEDLAAKVEPSDSVILPEFKESKLNLPGALSTSSRPSKTPVQRSRGRGGSAIVDRDRQSWKQQWDSNTNKALDCSMILAQMDEDFISFYVRRRKLMKSKSIKKSRGSVLALSTKTWWLRIAELYPQIARQFRSLLVALMTVPKGNISCRFHSLTTKGETAETATAAYEDHEISGLSGPRIFKVKLDDTNERMPGFLNCGCDEEPALLEVILWKEGLLRATLIDKEGRSKNVVEGWRGMVVDPRDRLYWFQTYMSLLPGVEFDDLFTHSDDGFPKKSHEITVLDKRIAALVAHRNGLLALGAGPLAS